MASSIPFHSNEKCEIAADTEYTNLIDFDQLLHTCQPCIVEDIVGHEGWLKICYVDCEDEMKNILSKLNIFQ